MLIATVCSYDYDAGSKLGMWKVRTKIQEKSLLLTVARDFNFVDCASYINTS